MTQVLRAALIALVAAFAVVGVYVGDATAQQTEMPTIEGIEVEGNRRVEAEAILQQVGSEVGEPVDDRQLGDDIRAIYSLGFFEDIQIDAQFGTEGGVILTFIVVEKPAIAEIRYVGNDRLDEADFGEVVDLRVGGILDESRVRANEIKIEDLYREKGYYLVEVDYEIIELEDGEVVVEFDIREYSRVQIGRVTFIGNEALSDREIQSVMRTRPGDFLSFLTQFGTFDRDNLVADLQNVRVYYYDNGYLDVAVGDPIIELSRDRTRLYITVPIEEGEPYTVSSVSVSGDLLLSQEETMEMVGLEPETTFRSSVIRSDIERISDYYRDLGYAHANVNMLHSIDPDEHRIAVQYDIQRGDLAYIGRIEVVGNTLTRDRVVRREMTILEGDLYSGQELRRSRAFVQRLGFFEDVQIREEVNEQDPAFIDLQVEVIERPTRSFQVGAGFSSVENFVATAQISENNLFGRGQSLSLNATLSSLRTLFVLSFVEPHLFDSEWQLSLNMFNRRILFTEFERASRGFDLSVGYRLTRELTLTVGYELEDVQVTPGGTSGNTETRFATLFDGGLTSSATTGAFFDTRNDRLFPSQGMFHSVNFELADAAFLSENEFFRVRTASRFYFEPVWDDWILKFNGEFGYVGSTNPDRAVPIFERFYVGGPTSVRGFERLSLSPVRPSGTTLDPFATTRGFPFGGNKELVFNAELEFPILMAVGIRGVVFMDAGNAFDNDEPLTLRLDMFEDAVDGSYGNVLRTAVGFGLRWRSPIGPLRFEWGFPLSRLDTERPMVFEFSIGDPF